MASDLPRIRIRVHDDGYVALHFPSPALHADWALEWLVVNEPIERRWKDDKETTGPGWRDAVIVPLPEPVSDPVEWHGQWPGVVQLTTLGSVHLAGYGFIPPAMARDLAAALLAAAAHVDQAKAVNTDG